MSLERLNKYISIGFGLALVACVATLVLQNRYSTQVLEAAAKRHQVGEDASRLFNINRELTQLARLYVSSGDERYRQQHALKWQEGRSFESVIADFREHLVSTEEKLLLTEVKSLNLLQMGMEDLTIRRRAEGEERATLERDDYIDSEQRFAAAMNRLSTLVFERLNADFAAAWEKSELAQRVNVLVELIMLAGGLLLLRVVLRRRLIIPLLALSERMRRLQAGESLAPMAQTKSVAEVEILAETLDAYAEINDDVRLRHWVKARLDEVLQAVQLCTSRTTFVEALVRQLDSCLGCESRVLFDGESIASRPGRVHYSLPLQQDGQQMASLELYFAHNPDAAQRALLDALPERLGTQLNLLEQQLTNQRLLSQARRQTRQLEAQAAELQQRQQALQSTESWYRGIVEAAPEALMVADEKGRVILANLESEAIFGYRRGELCGQPMRVLVPDSQVQALDELLLQLTDEAVSVVTEGLSRRADGSELPVEVRLCRLPVHQDQGRCLCVVIRDLSQHKGQELRLRQAHEQQQAMVTASPYGIAMVRHGRIVQTNLRLDELLGYAPGELANQSPLVWAPDVTPAIEAQVREELGNGQTFRIDLQLRCKDGSPFWGRVSARAIHSEDLGQGTIWIVEDINEQHALELEMARARTLAEEAAQIKADFLANMSHEIRTPMNAIIGMTHLALNTDLDKRQRDYLSKVQSASRHLLGLLDDILDFSKIEAGKLQLEAADFCLSRLLEEVVDQVRPRVAAKRLDLLFDIGTDVPERLRGDPLRLRQILLNYLSNAVKFTEQGYIRVGVELRQSSTAGVRLHFSVTDSGIGLSPEQVNNLFQSFQQADASTTRRYGGTGLGLAIAKQLVELMDGQVGVQSVQGEGSCFWFEARLQLADSTAAPVQLASQPQSGDWPEEGAHILLVEDNALNQQVASELLGAIGCRVDIAGDGRQALERLAEQRYDLVFMDMQMPVLDGLAATRLLRQQAALGDLPVIAMTANAMQKDRDACLAAGMNDFISKPFEPQTLYAVLQRWLVGARVGQPEPPRVTPALTLQLDGVDMLAGLRRVLNKRSLYHDLLGKYLHGQGPLLDELRSALAARDLATAERLAHSCKGVSAVIGANLVAELAAALEQGLHAGLAHAELEHRLQALAMPLTALLAQLREQLVDEQPVLLQDADLAQVQQVIRQLSELLGDFDAEAVPYFSEHAGLLRAGLADGFAHVSDALQRFDFEAALVCLQRAPQAGVLV